MLKTKLKLQNVNINKRLLKGFISQNLQRYTTFTDGRITQYMHEVACIFIVVPQQKWNNIYAGTLYKLEGGVQTFVFKMKSRLILKTSQSIRIFKFI